MDSAAHDLETTTGVDNRRFAMWTLVGSECFLFGTLITNYLIHKDRGVDGPKAAEIYDINLTTLSTFRAADEFCLYGFGPALL